MLWTAGSSCHQIKSIKLKSCLPGFGGIWIPKGQWDDLNQDFSFLDLGHVNADDFAGRVWSAA